MKNKKDNDKIKNSDDSNKNMDLDEAIRWIDKGFEELERLESSSKKKCDWCGVSPVTYSDEAHDLCENCHDQMMD
jgi:hypothetical protein